MTFTNYYNGRRKSTNCLVSVFTIRKYLLNLISVSTFLTLSLRGCSDYFLIWNLIFPQGVFYHNLFIHSIFDHKNKCFCVYLRRRCTKSLRGKATYHICCNNRTILSSESHCPWSEAPKCSIIGFLKWIGGIKSWI